MVYLCFMLRKGLRETDAGLGLARRRSNLEQRLEIQRSIRGP